MQQTTFRFLITTAAAVVISWSSWTKSIDASILYCDTAAYTVTNGVAPNPTVTAVDRDDTASDTVYIGFTIDPTSDLNDENYFGGLEFYDSGNNTFSIGNNWTAFAWSLYGASTASQDLNSANPEAGQTYQLVDATDGPVDFVAKIDYVSGGNDTLTIYLNPVAGDEASQPSSLQTTLTGDFSFDTVQFRIGNDDKTWTLDGLKMTTSFAEAVPEPANQTLLAFVFFTAVGFCRIRRRR